MQEQYKSLGFIIVASHLQDVTREKVCALCRSSKINYTVVSRGRVSGDTSNGIPHAFLFGPDGKLLKEGHPDSMVKDIEDAVTKAPHWITRGRKLESAAKGVADALKAGKPFGWAVAECDSLLKKGEPKVTEEAQFLKDELLAEGERQLAEAKAAEAEDPLRANALYQEIAASWKRSEPGTKAEARQKELKADKDYQSELKVAKQVAQIQELCDALIVKPGQEAPDMNLPQNQGTAQQILGLAKKLKKDHPDSALTKKCLASVAGYGINVP